MMYLRQTLARLLFAVASTAMMLPQALAAPTRTVAIRIDGVPRTPEIIDRLTTPTGTWPVFDLGVVADGRAYMFEYDSLPGWYSVCIVRWPDGDGQIDERAYRLDVSGRSIPITAFPGSMKCADNGEPVKPDMARLRQAVAERRVLPYEARAFAGFPTPRRLTPDRNVYAGYRPDRVYGRSSSNNAIGLLAGSGGESGSSRGFLANDDTVLIAAALAGDRNAFLAAGARGREQVLYGLSVPNFVIWSTRHHQMRDPQLPFAGDRAYANEGTDAGVDNYRNEGEWTAPADYPFLAELGAEPGKKYSHKRDEAHLFNHGYAYWLATGDPRAALLQQAIMAYTLAASYRRDDGRYRPRFGYQRATLNQFSALWKLRDITSHAASNKGHMFWPRARARKISGDIWRSWQAQLAALDASDRAHDQSVSIFRGIDKNDDNAYSSFMIQLYGADAAYLWASAGEPSLLRRIAENFVLRFGVLGGTRGVHGNGSGSGFPILEKGVMPYTDRASFIDWVAAKSPHPNDSFDDASPHTVLRGYWAMRLARHAVDRSWMPPMSGLDAAIERTERARDATRHWVHAGVLNWKHAGVDFGKDK